MKKLLGKFKDSLCGKNYDALDFYPGLNYEEIKSFHLMIKLDDRSIRSCILPAVNIESLFSKFNQDGFIILQQSSTMIPMSRVKSINYKEISNKKISK